MFRVYLRCHTALVRVSVGSYVCALSMLHATIFLTLLIV